jgi:thiosulfate dehydrogenase [quinone] large subunit
MLFLTVSFHSSPYYTGADIVFVFAWTPLLLAGAGPVLSLDAALDAGGSQERGSWPLRNSDVADAERRKVALTFLTATAGLVLGGLTAGVGRLAGGTTSGQGGGSALPPVSSSPQTSQSGRSGTGNPAGQKIGPASAVAVGGSAAFSDPKTGDPSIVIQPTAGKFLAFDAVCPHAGCTVEYDATAKLIVCPCHGSEFNPGTGAVESGPAPAGLTPIQVSESGGQLYAELRSAGSFARTEFQAIQFMPAFVLPRPCVADGAGIRCSASAPGSLPTLELVYDFLCGSDFSERSQIHTGTGYRP